MKGATFYSLSGCEQKGGIEASIFVLNIDGENLVLDVGYTDRTPIKKILGKLNSIEKPSGILVTHAHRDHIGLLPIVHYHRRFENIPIVMTPPTRLFADCMLKDAKKLDYKGKLKQYRGYKGKLDTGIDNTLDFCKLYERDFGDSIRLGNIDVTLIKAGHIPGAASFLIRGNEGTVVMYTGDISFTDFHTVSKASTPKEAVDLLITETTYADRTHQLRTEEVSNLISNLEKALNRKRAILIPSFALGRTQEILAIIMEKIAADQISIDFKVYIAGMALTITQIYSEQKSLYCPPEFKNNFHDQAIVGLSRSSNKPIILLESEDNLNEVSIHKPSIYLMSSGSLMGGPSESLACYLLPRKDTTVFIVGHQFKKSPGKRLSNIKMAKKQKGTVLLQCQKDEPPKRIAVNCEIEEHKLSAHGDQKELASFIAECNPKTVILVHGPSQRAKNKFAAFLRKELQIKVLVPENNQEKFYGEQKISLLGKHKTKPKPSPAPEPEREPSLTPNDIPELGRWLCDICGKRTRVVYYCQSCENAICPSCNLINNEILTCKNHIAPEKKVNDSS